MKTLDILKIIGVTFAAFFVLETRHASSERVAKSEQRILKVENSFEKWDIGEKIKKYEQRIEEIEGDWRGKQIPLEWLRQIEWLQKQIDQLKSELKEVSQWLNLSGRNL